MSGFSLLIGHLLGDYIFQNDWMAWNKRVSGWYGDIACTVHCLIYTLMVALCTINWMPLWGLLVIGITHWPIDRYSLAYKWMMQMGQSEFANGLKPWSIIIVDNTFHLLIMFIVALVAGVN